jgi:hypothetical protein
VRTCASRRKTQVFAARYLLRMQSGSLAWKSKGSPVLESDCTSREPMGASLMTRRKPCSRGPPLNRSDKPKPFLAAIIYVILANEG